MANTTPPNGGTIVDLSSSWIKKQLDSSIAELNMRKKEVDLIKVADNISIPDKNKQIALLNEEITSIGNSILSYRRSLKDKSN